MRVAIHADPACHAIPGGVGAYVRRLVEAVIADPGDAELELIVADSTDVPAGWPGDAIRRSGLPLRTMYMSWNWLRRPRVGSSDVVHAPSFAIPPGPRLVSMVQDDTIERYPQLVPSFWRRLYRRGFRVAIREARVVCVPSAAVARRLNEHHGVDMDRLIVTPLGPLVAPGHAEDGSVLERLAVRRPYVLSVSTLEPRKNQTGLVRAFAAAGLSDHYLVLAGALGWGTDEVRRAVAESGVAGRIVLTGAVTDDELASLYANAGSFALPSIYEGFGMGLLEAMTYGLPCVTSTDDALVELGAGATIAVDHADGDALAEALRSASTDGAVRSRLSEAGRARASAFGWKRTLDATRSAWARAGT